MTEYLAAQLGLGLAGFDPIGALLVAGALAAGASPRAVLAFAASCLAATLAVGAALALSLGPMLTRVTGWLHVPDAWWVPLELGVAVGLCAWGVRRLRNRPGQSSGRPRRVRGLGVAGMTISGALWGVAAATDPTFYASALLAGRHHNTLLMLAGLGVWYAVSQLPLHLLTGAVLAGRHRPAVRWLNALTTRWSTPARHVITALVFAGAAFLLADTAVFLATDRFLVG